MTSLKLKKKKNTYEKRPDKKYIIDRRLVEDILNIKLKYDSWYIKKTAKNSNISTLSQHTHTHIHKYTHKGPKDIHWKIQKSKEQAIKLAKVKYHL